MQKIKITTDVEKSALTKMIIQLFKHWRIPIEDQFDLLGLKLTNFSVLSLYPYGKPILIGKEQYIRLSLLLRIHKSLRILFANNKVELYSWMQSKNKAFKNRTPVQMVKEFGLTGLQIVNSYLDTKVIND